MARRRCYRQRRQPLHRRPRNHTIRKITPAGAVSTLAGKFGECGSADGSGADAGFDIPGGRLATDSAGNVYVGESYLSLARFGHKAAWLSCKIRKLTPDGIASTLAGNIACGSADGSDADARFGSPSGVATDGAGNVYVADSGNHTIRKITPAGIVTTVVGVAGRSGFAPGALPGVLASPRDVAVSGTSLYVTLYNGVAVVTNLP